MVKFKAPLSPGRSMKYNLFQFKSHVPGEAPHLGIAIFNNNSIGKLTDTSRRISLLHVLAARHLLKFVPLEIHIASPKQNSMPHAKPQTRAWRHGNIYSLIDVDRTHIVNALAAFIHTHGEPRSASGFSTSH